MLIPRKFCSLLRFTALALILALVSACNMLPQQDAPLTPALAGDEDQPTSIFRPDVVDRFSVFVPADLSLCETAQPWAAGKRELVDWSSLQSGTCFGLGYSLKKPAYAFLIYEDPNGRLSRLRPDDCSISDRQRVPAGQMAEFPSPGKIIELDNNPGGETFHLLAILDRKVASRTLAAALALPSPSVSCKRPKAIQIRDLTANALEELVNSDKRAVQWITRTILHR